MSVLKTVTLIALSLKKEKKSTKASVEWYTLPSVKMREMLKQAVYLPADF